MSDGRVYIGGDSAGSNGHTLITRADAKVFAKGGFIFGFTSSFRMGQLLRYSFEPPKRHPDTDLMAYMVTQFIDALRACMKAGGFARTDSSVEAGGTFLVGHAGRLFAVYDDYQVGEAVADYEACGCGDQLARGAMFATAGGEPEARIRAALAAAEAHSPGVRGPFHIESI